MADNFGILGNRKRKRGETTKPDRPAAMPRPEATAEGDLGRMPTMGELAAGPDSDLEGHLAAVTVTVYGRTIHVSKVRSQEQIGILLAEATREQMEAEAHFRAWRARQGIEIVRHSAKGVPEWRVRQLTEAEPDFLTYQTAIARATANTMVLRAVWETWGDE